MTVSTLTVAPGTTIPGAAPAAEPPPWSPPYRSTDTREQALIRAAQPDYHAWLAHVQPAAGCTRPIRLAGTIDTYTHTATNPGRVSWASADLDRIRWASSVATADMPDGVIYKPCGNRRASVCPSCSETYRRDAYQIIKVGLVGGKSVPDHVAQHPALFVTFTAPSFGEVHTRVVTRHTCQDRRRCDCRPQPCHPRRDIAHCPHSHPRSCFARHETGDQRLGTPLCPDCYDYPAQVVWNLSTPELWRRTGIAIRRHVRRTTRSRGVDPDAVRVELGKVAEMQRRGAIHLHAIIRLDGADPTDADAILPPPSQLGLVDLADAIEHAAAVTGFTTGPHPAHHAVPGWSTCRHGGHAPRPHRPTPARLGWAICWGEQLDLRTVNAGTGGEITDSMVAGYLAKYATKSTEVTGHVSARLDADTIDLYADPAGTHVERIIDACWRLGAPKQWRRLRSWAHMLGFGGHFLTKSRRYSVTFRILREARVIWRRDQSTGPQSEAAPEHRTTLVVNFLQFVGSGWKTTGDALLANTSAAMARERQRVARDEMAALAA